MSLSSALKDALKDEGLRVYIQPDKKKSRNLAKAVVSGAVALGYKSSVAVCPAKLAAGPVPVIVGAHETNVPILKACSARKIPFITIDNGYFSPYKRGGYFRATTNALQWARLVGEDPAAIDCTDAKKRFDQHNIEIKPWRRSGESLLFTLQSEAWRKMFLNDQKSWVDEIADRLAKASSRPINVRFKPRGDMAMHTTFEQDLKSAWAVISLSSNTLVESALEGVPPVALGLCAASVMSTPLEQVEFPKYPEYREAWAWELAANQWNIHEMMSGRMLEELTWRYRDQFVDTLA